MPGRFPAAVWQSRWRVAWRAAASVKAGWLSLRDARDRGVVLPAAVDGLLGVPELRPRRFRLRQGGLQRPEVGPLPPFQRLFEGGGLLPQPEELLFPAVQLLLLRLPGLRLHPGRQVGVLVGKPRRLHRGAVAFHRLGQALFRPLGALPAGFQPGRDGGQRFRQPGGLLPGGVEGGLQAGEGLLLAGNQAFQLRKGRAGQALPQLPQFRLRRRKGGFHFLVGGAGGFQLAGEVTYPRFARLDAGGHFGELLGLFPEPVPLDFQLFEAGSAGLLLLL